MHSKLIDDIHSMNNITAEKAGLSKAKLVKIKKDRKCFCCNKIISKGSEAITASHMIDKKKKVMLKDLYNQTAFYTSDYRFVPERHWVCLECAEGNVKKKFKKEEYFDFELIDLDEYSYDMQLELITKAYDYGQITGEEYDDLERVIIDAIALQEAVGIGQS